MESESSGKENSQRQTSIRDYRDRFGVGHCALEMLYGAVALGGHIRVGMEDNVVYEVKENGEKVMATNHMLVERAVNAVKAFGNTKQSNHRAGKCHV